MQLRQWSLYHVYDICFRTLNYYKTSMIIRVHNLVS